MLEHLGMAEGHALPNCAESCPSLDDKDGGFCNEYMTPLNSNSGKPAKCFECRRSADPIPKSRKERND